MSEMPYYPLSISEVNGLGDKMQEASAAALEGTLTEERLRHLMIWYQSVVGHFLSDIDRGYWPEPEYQVLAEEIADLQAPLRPLFARFGALVTPVVSLQ